MRLRAPRFVVVATIVGSMLVSVGHGCGSDTLPALGGGGAGGIGGFGGGTGGTGILRFTTCDACLSPKSGAVTACDAHHPSCVTCEPEKTACDGDPGCTALLACVANGYSSPGGSAPEKDRSPRGLGGAGGTGGAGGAGGATGGGGTSGVGAASGAGASGGAASGGGGASATGGGAVGGAGGVGASGEGGGPILHGHCDTSFEGACCALDCAAALGTSPDSLMRFAGLETCVNCEACRSLCGVAEAYCDVLEGDSAACH